MHSCSAATLKLGSFTIICLNLREFGYVIVRDHLWDPHDQIKIGLPNHLSDQVSPISDFLQSLA
jgi:hypothetical protein